MQTQVKVLSIDEYCAQQRYHGTARTGSVSTQNKCDPDWPQLDLVCLQDLFLTSAVSWLKSEKCSLVVQDVGGYILRILRTYC